MIRNLSKLRVSRYLNVLIPRELEDVAYLPTCMHHIMPVI